MKIVVKRRTHAVLVDRRLVGWLWFRGGQWVAQRNVGTPGAIGGSEDVRSFTARAEALAWLISS